METRIDFPHLKPHELADLVRAAEAPLFAELTSRSPTYGEEPDPYDVTCLADRVLHAIAAEGFTITKAK